MIRATSLASPRSEPKASDIKLRASHLGVHAPTLRLECIVPKKNQRANAQRQRGTLARLTPPQLKYCFSVAIIR